MSLLPDVISAFLSIHSGSVATDAVPVFRDSILLSLLPGSTLEDRKAYGLWIVFCSAPDHFNWKTPGNIATVLGRARTPVTAWFKLLWAKGLVFYSDTRQEIGVSRFPEGIHPHLYPIVLEVRNIPWNAFARERV